MTRKNKSKEHAMPWNTILHHERQVKELKEKHGARGRFILELYEYEKFVAITKDHYRITQ